LDKLKPHQEYLALGDNHFQAGIEAMLNRRARKGLPGRPRGKNLEPGGSVQAIAKNVACP
jgi:hypothetical protein